MVHLNYVALDHISERDPPRQQCVQTTRLRSERDRQERRDLREVAAKELQVLDTRCNDWPPPFILSLSPTRYIWLGAAAVRRTGRERAIIITGFSRVSEWGDLASGAAVRFERTTAIDLSGGIGSSSRRSLGADATRAERAGPTGVLCSSTG
jgi:hypothetical protein